jgi:hypothetical protein
MFTFTQVPKRPICRLCNEAAVMGAKVLVGPEEDIDDTVSRTFRRPDLLQEFGCMSEERG